MLFRLNQSTRFHSWSDLALSMRYNISLKYTNFLWYRPRYMHSLAMFVLKALVAARPVMKLPTVSVFVIVHIDNSPVRTSPCFSFLALFFLPYRNPQRVQHWCSSTSQYGKTRLLRLRCYISLSSGSNLLPQNARECRPNVSVDFQLRQRTSVPYQGSIGEGDIVDRRRFSGDINLKLHVQTAFLHRSLHVCLVDRCDPLTYPLQSLPQYLNLAPLSYHPDESNPLPSECFYGDVLAHCLAQNLLEITNGKRNANSPRNKKDAFVIEDWIGMAVWTFQAYNGWRVGDGGC
jgi:hypothetical protein